jgi:hypothetical protein
VGIFAKVKKIIVTYYLPVYDQISEHDV